MEHATKDIEQSGGRRKGRNENWRVSGELGAIPACSSRSSWPFGHWCADEMIYKSVAVHL
jgi:hypothetical protein